MQLGLFATEEPCTSNDEQNRVMGEDLVARVGVGISTQTIYVVPVQLHIFAPNEDSQAPWGLYGCAPFRL